jgi:hypothetical protein
MTEIKRPLERAGEERRNILNAFQRRAIDALLVMAGREPTSPEPGHKDYLGYSLVSLARECLFQRGGATIYDQVEAMAREALRESDLSVVLEKFSRRVILDGYNRADETFGQWTVEGVATSADGLTIVEGVLESGERPEEKNIAPLKGLDSFELKKFSWEYKLPLKIIVDDDLQALVDLATWTGNTVKRHVGDFVYALFAENPLMSDGAPLFHPTHSNVIEGQADDEEKPKGQLAMEKLKKAVLALSRQKDSTGRYLNCRPRVFLAPCALMDEAETYFQSSYLRDPQGAPLKRIYEPRLDDQNPRVGYLLGPKEMGARIYNFEGVKRPLVEGRIDPGDDGLIVSTTIYLAVKPVSYQAMARIEF